MSCLAAEAKGVTQKNHLNNTALSQGEEKGEEIHKAISHVWLSGRLHLSSLFSVALPPLIASALLDSGFSPGATVENIWWISRTLSLEGLLLTVTVV